MASAAFRILPVIVGCNQFARRNMKYRFSGYAGCIDVLLDKLELLAKWVALFGVEVVERDVQFLMSFVAVELLVQG